MLDRIDQFSVVEIVKQRDYIVNLEDYVPVCAARRMFRYRDSDILRHGVRIADTSCDAYCTHGDFSDISTNNMYVLQSSTNRQ